MTLRTKTTLYFCAGSVCVWGIISLLLFSRFKKSILSGFDDGLKAKAALVISKTSLLPPMVPLPENGDLFVIVYHAAHQTDTLYQSHNFPLAAATTDSVFISDHYRAVRLQQTSDNGDSLEVLYAASDDTVQQQINQLRLFLWETLLAGVSISAFIAAYFATKLLRPLRQVIRQANTINLNQNLIPLTAATSETEGQELVASINRMLARIQEQAERQTAFFAAASHELRTPLSVMQTRLQVLQQTVGENKMLAEVYHSQLEQVQRLSKMVNDFLLMSQLQNSRPDIRTETIDLVAIISESTAAQAAKAAQKGIRFRLDFQPTEADFEITADQEKIVIILSNLLDNAVKYGAENNVVTIAVQQQKGQVAIHIANAIRPDIQPEPADIKNAFYQARPLHGEGFGLGLWIVSQLAALQNMDLYCSISRDKMFTATLVIIS